jgi:hypothetical protein
MRAVDPSGDELDALYHRRHLARMRDAVARLAQETSAGFWFAAERMGHERLLQRELCRIRAEEVALVKGGDAPPMVFDEDNDQAEEVFICTRCGEGYVGLLWEGSGLCERCGYLRDKDG